MSGKKKPSPSPTVTISLNTTSHSPILIWLTDFDLSMLIIICSNQILFSEKREVNEAPSSPILKPLPPPMIPVVLPTGEVSIPM